MRNPTTNRKMNSLHIVRIDDGFHQTPIASADQTLALALAMFAVYVKSGVMPPAYRMSDEAYIKGMTQ